MVKAQGGVGLGAKQIVGGIEGGSTLPFDIMIPWNIVRRIPRERKDGWNLMNGLLIFYFASLGLFETDLDVDGLCLVYIM